MVCRYDSSAKVRGMIAYMSDEGIDRKNATVYGSCHYLLWSIALSMQKHIRVYICLGV